MRYPNNRHPEADHDRVFAGLEIEFAARSDNAPPMESEGVTVWCPRQYDDGNRRPGKELTHAVHGGEWTYEHIGRGVKSVEARTPDGGIPLEDLAEWYSGAVHEVESDIGFDMEPVGITPECPVGLHTHLSPLTEEQARKLYELSEEDWMPVFVCSSLASRTHEGYECDNFPVIRERGSHFCDFSRGFGSHHYCPVNKHRGGGLGHYEWRVPEPVTPDHFELIAEFLARFMDDPDGAAEWAKEQVFNDEGEITALQRAKKIGDPLLEPSSTKTPSTAVVEEVVFS